MIAGRRGREILGVAPFLCVTTVPGGLPRRPVFVCVTLVPGETVTLAARRRDNGARGKLSHSRCRGGVRRGAELVTGDYTFSLRPQGTTGDYYGYTVTLTVSVTMPQTVDELRETYRQKLADALAVYTEADYLTDDWADIEAAYQQALDAINAATDETAMQEAVAGFQTAANLVPAAAERLAAERQRLLAELDQAYAAYDEADYTTEGWAELTAAYEQGRQGIASATSIADEQAAQQAALSAMAAVAQKPADPETDPDTILATGDPATIAALMGLGGSAMLAVGVVARKRG